MSLHQSVVTNGKDGRGLKLEKKKKKGQVLLLCLQKSAKNYCCYCSLMKLV